VDSHDPECPAKENTVDNVRLGPDDEKVDDVLAHAGDLGQFFRISHKTPCILPGICGVSRSIKKVDTLIKKRYISASPMPNTDDMTVCRIVVKSMPVEEIPLARVLLLPNQGIYLNSTKE